MCVFNYRFLFYPIPQKLNCADCRTINVICNLFDARAGKKQYKVYRNYRI